MKKLLILILDGSEILEIAPFIDVFGWNNIINKQEKIEVVTAYFSADNSIKISFSKMSLLPQLSLNKEKINIDDFEAIIVPGGFGKYGYFKNYLNENLKEIISNFIEKNKIIVGVCTGSLILAEMGYLKNKKATTYLREKGRYHNQLKNYGVKALRKEIVIDRNIITSSSPKTALKIAFLILEKLTSKKNRKLVQEEMGY